MASTEIVTPSNAELTRELDSLRIKLAEAERKLAEAQELIQAIQQGDVDAVVVSGPAGDQVFSLRDAEYGYRALVEAMSEGAATLASDGTVLYCNERLAHLLEAPLEKIIGGHATRHLADETARVFEALLDQARQGKSITTGLDLQTVKGRSIPVQISLREFDSVGTTAYCMVVTDLTQTKARDRTIAEERLATLVLQSAAEAIAVCDETGLIIAGNGALESLCGSNPLFRPFDAVLPLELAERQEAPAQNSPAAEALGGLTFAGRKMRLRRRDGVAVSLLVSGSPLRSSGAISGCVLTLTDITERERAEEALRESRAKFKAALASMTDSVLITDAQGRFVEFNDSFASFYRFKSKAECAKNFDELASIFEVCFADGKPVAREMYAINRALAGETGMNVECAIRRKDTGERWIGSISFSPIRDRNGAIAGAVITARDITEAKRAEMRLRRFYETDLFAILYWKIDGGVVDVNDKFLEMTGYTREDLRAGLLNWSQITPPEYWPLDEDARRQILETGIHLPFEKEFVRKDGTRVWGQFSAAAYEDDRTQGVSFILDITERKRAEAALRQEKATLQGILDATLESIWLIGADSTFISANTTALKRWGGQSKDIFGKTFKDILDPPLAESRSACIRRVVETGKPLEQEDERAGMIFRHQYYPVLDSDGRINRAVVFSRDITESRRAEETLERYRLLAGHTRDIVLFIRYEDGLILEANAAAAEAYGYPIEQLKRMTIHDLREPHTRSLAPVEMAQAEMQGLLFQSIHQRADGSVFPVEVSSQGAKIGQTRTLISIIRDITERRRMEDALRESEEEFRVLAQNLVSGVALINEHGEFRIVNESFLRIFDLDEHSNLLNINSRDWSQWRVFDEGGRLLDADEHPVRRAVLTRTTVKDSLVAVQAPGRADCRWLLVSAEPILDDNGDVLRVICTYHDITARKQAEEALRESEERYRSLFNSMNEGFCVIEVLFDADGKPADYIFLEANSAFEKQTGLHDAVGKRMRELAPEHEEHWFEIYGKIALTGEPAHFMNEAKALHRYYDVHAYRVGEPEQRRVAIVFNDFSDYKRAEEALRASEEQLQAIIDGAPDTAVFLKDAEGRFITVNSGFERLLGVTRDEVRGKTDYDILTRERAEEYRANDLQVLTTGQPILLEESALLADGTEHTFLANKFPLFDAGGKPYAVCAISADITVRKRMEEALRASELRFRLALTNAPVSVAMQDRDLVFRWAYNQQTRSAEEIVGRTDAELFAAEEVPAIFEVKRRVLETGNPEHIQQWLTSNGKRRFLDIYFEPTRNAAGVIDGIGIATVDLTERKCAEEALAASEEQFRNLANAIPQLCWMANADGWRFWYNARWYEYTGTTPEQMEGWGWRSVHDSDALPQVMESWKESIAAGTPLNEVFPLRGADGISRPFLTRVVPIKDMDGKVVRWFGTNTDITEQKQIEADLRKNEERLGVALEVAQLGEWERDLKTGVGTRSLRHAKIFGYSSAESAWNFEIFLSHIVPEQRAEVIAWYKSSLRGGSWDFEGQIRRLDGELRWLWFRSHTRLDETGQPARAYGIVMDITDRKQAEERLWRQNRTLKALSNSNQAILHAADEPAFLNEVCRIITRDCGHAMVWIGIAENDQNKTVRPVAFSGFDEGYLEKLNVTWDESERGRGPTGTAIRTGQPSMCRDMRTDPAFGPWREQAAARGYASSLVIPLKEQDRTWGAISIYSRLPDAFSQEEIDLLAELAGDLDVGIQSLRMKAARAQAEESLRESTELLGLFVEHAPVALAMFDNQMRYLYASRRWKTDYGQGDNELRGVSHYDVFSELPEHWKEAHRRALAGEVLSAEGDRFERPDGVVQWVRWQIRPWRDAEGKVGGIVIFTEDITRRREAEAAVQRSERLARQRQELQALAKRLQQVREEERKVVARDLHDHIGQILTAIKFDMTWVERHLPRPEDGVRKRLTGSIELINDCVKSVRKICSGLRPGILDDLGLAAAIEWQANEFSTRTGVPCQLSLPSAALELDGDRATAIFRIFQECLTNVTRHAEAQTVHTSLQTEGRDLVLVVRDDGKGFHESQAAGSLGVLGMKERAAACGGSVQLSSSPGKGTTVTVRIPLDAESLEREDHEHSHRG